MQKQTYTPAILGIALLFTLALTACGPKIYKSADFESALRKHRIVAIVPAEVTIKLRPNQAKRILPAELYDMERNSGYDIQDKMYGWFLRRSDKYHYTVRFQDIVKTNSILRDAGIDYKDLRETDRAKLAEILGVDAVMQDRLVTEKPMSDGAAVAVGLLVGFWGSTNTAQTTINIHDGFSGDLLWKYDYEVSGSVGSSSARMVDALMRNATKKFPYSY